MRNILISAVAALPLVSGISTDASSQSMPILCLPHDKMVELLGRKFGQTRIGIGVAAESSGPVIVELFASENGRWTLTLSSPSGLTCLAKIGTDWQTTQPDPGLGS